MTNGRVRSGLTQGTTVKVGFPLLLGLVVLVGAYVGGVSGPSALELAAVVAFGVALMLFIVDTERRVSGVQDAAEKRVAALQEAVEKRIAGLWEHVDQGFASVDRSAELAGLVAGSAFDAPRLTKFLEAAGKVDSQSNPLMRLLAQRQIDTLTDFMQRLPVDAQVSYEGEDRDWMLGLTIEAQHTIDGISLTTVDAGMRGFDGGLWTSDLGTRYLELQREAVARKVRIRRIFIFENAELAADETFQRITMMQREVGIEVRKLDQQLIPEALQSLIFDVIIFDGALSYEMTPAAAFAGNTRPAIVRTLLDPKSDRVRDVQDRFERLWEAANPDREI